MNLEWKRTGASPRQTAKKDGIEWVVFPIADNRWRWHGVDLKTGDIVLRSEGEHYLAANARKEVEKRAEMRTLSKLSEGGWDFTAWFDELEWEKHVYEIVDNDGIKNGDTVDIYEATYESDGKTNLIVMEDYGLFATWQALIWDGRPIPTMIQGRGPFDSLADVKACIRQWFKDGCPIQRWTQHTAQRRTWKNN